MAKPSKKAKPPVSKKRKITLLVGLALVVIILAGLAAYKLIEHRSNSTYYSILTQINEDYRAQLGYYSKESKELEKLRNANDKISFDNPSSFRLNRSALTESRRIATQVFDRMLDHCESYQDTYLHSSEIEDPDQLILLSDDKKQTIKRIKELLKETEDDSCTETKGLIGKTSLDIDTAEALNNWMRLLASEYTDTDAINSLKGFADGSYEIPHRSEIESTYIKEVVEAGDHTIELMAAAYDYATEQNQLQFDAKWNDYMSAYEKFSAYSYSDALLKHSRASAKESHQRSLEFFDLITKANQSATKDTKFSPSIYSGLLINSALNNYYVDYEYEYPKASNLSALIKDLDEKRYLDQEENLSTNGLEYSVRKGKSRTLTITDDLDEQSYELIFLE